MNNRSCSVPVEVIAQVNALPIKVFCQFTPNENLLLYRVTKPYDGTNKYTTGSFYAPQGEKCHTNDRFRLGGKIIFYGTSLSNLAFYEAYQNEICIPNMVQNPTLTQLTSRLLKLKTTNRSILSNDFIYLSCIANGSFIYQRL